MDSITNKKWYVFNKHRWEKDEGQRLRMAISKDLFELYSEKQNQYLSEVQHYEQNDENHEKIQRKIKKIAEISGKQDPCKFITDFFPALGFGDVLAVTKKGEYEIIVNYFPWLGMYKDIGFTMFRGMLSGVISGFTGKKVELNKIDTDVSSGYLFLHITEG